MKARVYRNLDKESRFRACLPPSMGQMIPVAEVSLGNGRQDIDFLELAFEKTNNIVSAWYDRPGVTLLGVPREAEYLRSTSVGDVIELIPDGDESGKKFLVAMTGFESLLQHQQDLTNS